MNFNLKHKHIVENRGDNYKYLCSYKSGEITLDGKITKNKTYVRVKCPYCNEEYDVRLDGFKKGNKCSNCCNTYENSLAYYIQIVLSRGLNEFWSWKDNKLNPYLIPKYSNEEITLKCDKIIYHDKYKTLCSNFSNGNNRCPQCTNHHGNVHPLDSFAQWGIDNIDNDFLNKYWSSKNTINPWKISPSSSNKIYIKCQEKDYHEDYLMTCNNFHRGHRCPQCNNTWGNVHKLDSFGSIKFNLIKCWDYNKNNVNPYNITPKTKNKYWFKCEKCKKSCLKSIANINKHVLCDECLISTGEYKIIEWLNLNKLIKDEDYFYDIEYFNDLLSSKGYVLRPDFILPKQKIWIEYDGYQHYTYPNNFHSTILEYEEQQERDIIKNKYADKNGYKMIRIKEYEYENINTILKENIKID